MKLDARLTSFGTRLQIDIHYSLPRDEDNPKRKCDREKNQGTIRVVLKGNSAPIREQELERMFGGFGDIKGMYFSGGNPATERLVEFFDTRATCEAYDRMQNAPYPTGGKVELFFDWDVKDIPISHPSAGPRPTNRNGSDHRPRDSMPPPPTPMSAAAPSNYDRPPSGPPQQYHPDTRAPFGQDNRPPYQQNNERPPYQPNPHNQPPPDFRQPPVPQQMPPPPLPPHHFNGQPPTPASSVPPHPPTPRDYDRPPYGNQAPPTPSYTPNNNAPPRPPSTVYNREVTPQYQPGANPNAPLGHQPVSGSRS